MTGFSRVVITSLFATAAGMKCPGTGAWLGHAKTQVVTTSEATCAQVKEEISARASGKNGWVDPHNGGIYSVLSSGDLEVNTQRTTNPAHSVAHQVFTDKQTYTLTDKGSSCEVSACSESQGSSMKDFSTNYCDIRNLFCGSEDGCTPVVHDFKSTQTSVDASSGQSDWSQCVVKDSPAPLFLAALAAQCPGSSAWVHAKTQVTATAKTSCANVKAEIVARAGGKSGFVDPHNGGIYSVQSSSDTSIATQRTTNPKHSVGGKVYTDKQLFSLTDKDGSCQISGCSESQTTSIADFSTNYCDLRNLYCGTADGCKPVKNDFSSTEDSVTASSHQHDWSKCVVKADETVV